MLARVVLLPLLILLIWLPSVDDASRPQPAPLTGATNENRHQSQPQQDSEEIIITPIYHASLVLQYGGKAIYVDPRNRGDYHGLPMADLVLVTDIHPDHLDIEAIAQRMGINTVVIGPAAVSRQWGGVDVVLKNGERKQFGDILVEAVAMYNIKRGPSEGQLYHDKGRGNGYVVTFGGKRIYISGDTECTAEMRRLEDIDIAFVCMNLPYTMTPGEAAECVKAFRPKIVYPYHYRGSDLGVFTWALKDTPEVEVKLLDWYPKP